MNPTELGPRGPATRPGQSVAPNRRLISLADAAEMLGMSAVSVRRLVCAGTLPAVRLNRRILIDRNDIDHLIQRSKDRPNY